MTQQLSNKNLYKRAFAISWAVVCIVVFMIYTGRLSVVHGSSFGNLLTFTQKLAEIQPLAYAGNLLLSFIEIVLFSLACILGGALPVSAALSYNEINLKKSPSLLSIILGTWFLVGHWLFSSTFLLLAIYSLLTPSAIIFTLLVGCSLGIYPARKILLLFKKNDEDRHSINNLSKSYRIIYWLSLIALFTGLLYSTSRLSYDSVAIYFSDAKIIALTNHFQFFQGNSFLLSSLQTGIQFSALIQLFGDQTARMFPWISGCIVLVFILAIAEKVGISSHAKGIFFTLTLTSTAFMDLLGDGKVELTSSAIALAAIYWLLNSEKKAHKLLTGFLAGLAMVSRPYNIFLLGIFIGSLLIGNMYDNRKINKKFGFASFATSIFWIGLGGTIPFVFHLTANWLAFGTPLAMLTDAQNMTTKNWQWSFDPQYIWLMRSLYPFVVTFLNTPQSIGNVSPVFLAFLPYILSSNIRKKMALSRSLIELLTATLITLTLWIALFFTIMEIRYIFFIWAILFIVMSEVIVAAFDDAGNKLQILLSALLITLLVFTILRTIYFSVVTYSPLDRQGNPQCKDFIFCNYLKPINDGAQPGERVLSLLAYRYYLRTDLFACSTSMDEYRALRVASLKSPNEFWEEVYRQGYTYIAYEKNYSVRHLFMTFIPSPANTPSWIVLEPIYRGAEDSVMAYKIDINQPPIARLKTCSQNESGIWKVLDINSP